MFEIRIDDRQLKQLERTLAGIPRALPQVMSRALNRTATEARTKISRSLSQETGLRVKDVRDRTLLQRASYHHWHSAVRISRKRIPLMRFGARQTAKGVTYRKEGRRILIRSAFLATMASGHTGVFKRRDRRRLPISELRGPSLGQVFVGADTEVQRLLAESSQRLAKNIHDQVRLILARRAG